MKVVIFAGGLGSRLGEETSVIPKPMIRIGEYPIIWHIMKIYSFYGFDDFVILCGYKSDIIKQYFVGYYMMNSDITIDYRDNSVEIHRKTSEKWKVTLVDTGLSSMTGARLRKAQSFLKEDAFFLTYGDGLADINPQKMLEIHRKSGKILTLTAVRPHGRFGALEIDGDKVSSFAEKKDNADVWVNGGFFVVNSGVFDYIPDGDEAVFEEETLHKLVRDDQVLAHKHTGFWRCMDTLKDKNDLNEIWNSGNVPWRMR